MDLFDYVKETRKEKTSPLASRMRPRSLEEVVGQQHIIGKGRLLYRAIKADKLSSVIFYGPPGTGKTSLAQVIARTTRSEFRQINATTAGKKDMETVVEEAKTLMGGYGRRTILFIDEIHRFNKAQQDYLLPYVEDGTLVLIGATTENPYFEVNSALLSRSTLFELHPLETADIAALLDRAMADEDRGLGAFRAELLPEARDFLAEAAGGDARGALNALELAVLTTDPDASGRIVIDRAMASDCIQKKIVRYDKDGEQHYDTISAFIKSMRGSDPDAAVYYLARMLEAGEDIKFISRRIMICASEDVGMADPQALVVATAAALAVERVGMPEARILLSEAAVYVATAPKSNASYLAVNKAMQSVREKRTSTPGHLMNIHANGEGDEKKAVGYRYAHDYPNHWVEQQYLPDEILGERFYEPTGLGYEETVMANLKKLKGQ
ncbi:MAG: replication-associated recombination protein A [Lachnospiraceae bacterium]|nr:replication-associated recombination protein A [Lachnospiraceae bacterium]